jgi:hypothetical protein
MNHIPATPAKSTPLSSITETRCHFPNSANSGLPSLVASIDPIFTRNSAIRGFTACCDTTVKTIIAITDKAAGFTRLIGEAVRTNRAASNTTPQITPIMCIHHNVYPTIAPDESRLAKIRNAPGATTKLKNTSLPSHKPNARNSTVRKKVNIRAPQNRANRRASKFC